MKSKGFRKINLLYVSRGMFIGGAELVVANLCRNLSRELFNISVCFLEFNGPIGKALFEEGFDVFGLPKSKMINIKYLSFMELARIVKQRNIDIIHSHDTAALIESALCKIISSRTKLIHTFHFGNYPHRSKNDSLLEKISWRMSDKLIAVGSEQKKTIQETYKIPNNKIQVIWNGINKSKADVDHDLVKLFTADNKVIIGSLSTLREQKGLTYLLDVADILKKRSNDFIFIVVGDGPLREELEVKCKSLGLQDIVFFLGWVEDAASRILPIFDIFFQPSLWEAMSMVLLEAMAEGIPVVATDVGENKYVVDNGKTGYIIKPKDINNMVMALEKLILQPDLRKKFGLLAPSKVEQYFTAESMARNYEEVYQELLIK